MKIEWYEAFVNLQGELKPITHDSNNPFFKSTYASLSHIEDVIKPIMLKHGFAYFQYCDLHNDSWVLRTSLVHKTSSLPVVSGLWPIKSKDDTAQGYASGTTYARRYALLAILGLSTTDDDGNEATKTPTNVKPLPNKAPVAPLQKLRELAEIKGLSNTDMADLINRTLGVNKKSAEMLPEEIAKVTKAVESIK